MAMTCESSCCHRLFLYMFGFAGLISFRYMPTDTIFAFLMLNTPRSAHNKIFGAKFLSFERLRLYR